MKPFIVEVRPAPIPLTDVDSMTTVGAPGEQVPDTESLSYRLARGLVQAVGSILSATVTVTIDKIVAHATWADSRITVATVDANSVVGLRDEEIVDQLVKEFEEPVP